MNTGYRPIPDTMPIDEAAALMVRRGECRNFYAAKAKVAYQRAQKHQKTEPVTPLRSMESRRVWLPYADD